MGRAGHAAGRRGRLRRGERQDARTLSDFDAYCVAQSKAGPRARLFCEKSPDFQGFYRFSGLVAGTVLSKVRFLPVESFVPVFSWKGSYMNKNELVSAVADAAKISKGDAQSAVDAVFSVITGELKKWRGRPPGRLRQFHRFQARCLDGPQPADRRGGQDSRSHRAEILGRQGPQGRGQLIEPSGIKRRGR